MPNIKDSFCPFISFTEEPFREKQKRQKEKTLKMTEGALHTTFVTVFCSGGGDTQQSSIRGDSVLRPSPFLFDIPMFDRKGTPFIYLV